MNVLEKFTKDHKRSCAMFRFSDRENRHCSCGRDQAATELAAMRQDRDALIIERDNYRGTIGYCRDILYNGDDNRPLEALVRGMVAERDALRERK